MEYDVFLAMILENMPQQLKDNALFIRFIK